MPNDSKPELRRFEVKLDGHFGTYRAAYYGLDRTGEFFEFKDENHKITLTAPKSGVVYIKRLDEPEPPAYCFRCLEDIEPESA